MGGIKHWFVAFGKFQSSHLDCLYMKKRFILGMTRTSAGSWIYTFYKKWGERVIIKGAL